MPDSNSRDRLDGLGVAASVICCLLWGGNAVAVKFAVPDFPPLGCAAIRFLFGLPIVAVVVRSTGASYQVARPLWGLLLLHGFLTAVQIGTFNWGTSHSEAGRSSVFINIHPLIVAPLAWFLLGERFGLRGLAGLTAAVTGVVILLSETLRSGGGFKGDLVVLGSGLLFGIQTIAQKKTFPYIPPTTLLFGQSILAAIITAVFSMLFEGPSAFHVTPRAVAGVLYQGLAVSGLCFALWMILLRRYPAGRLATVAFLTPLFGVGLGHMLRAEPLTVSLLAGGVCVGLGIFLVASDRTARKAEPALGLPGEDAP